uniref:HMG box domain-containing protein n=1 Tax=Panagrellus redivivus TaxID=6233 RepID=A0A7E4ZQA9_PANRE
MTGSTIKASVTVTAEEAVETPKSASPKPAAKKSGSKKKKDPNMPKNPVNAYLHWSKVHRADYVKPGMKGVDVTRAAARAWKNLTDKTVWQQMADADKKRYDREMAEYNARQC